MRRGILKKSLTILTVFLILSFFACEKKKPALLKIGVFRSGVWYIDRDGDGKWNPSVDARYSFGNPDDIPLLGDWNGDGIQEIGVFRKGSWYLDYDGNGLWEPAQDKRYLFGNPYTIPLIGDWNQDGKDEIGVFEKGVWYLDYNGNGKWDGPDVDKRFNFGSEGDKPLLGRF
jgi:hypothetical protein